MQQRDQITRINVLQIQFTTWIVRPVSNTCEFYLQISFRVGIDRRNAEERSTGSADQNNVILLRRLRHVRMPLQVE